MHSIAVARKVRSLHKTRREVSVMTIASIREKPAHVSPHQHTILETGALALPVLGAPGKYVIRLLSTSSRRTCTPEQHACEDGPLVLCSPKTAPSRFEAPSKILRAENALSTTSNVMTSSTNAMPRTALARRSSAPANVGKRSSTKNPLDSCKATGFRYRIKPPYGVEGRFS